VRSVHLLSVALVAATVLASCGDDAAGPATTEFLDALEAEGQGDDFASEDGAARYLTTFCDLFGRFGDAAVEDDLDRLGTRFCPEAEDRPDPEDAPGVTAVYPDFNGEPVTIDDRSTAFTGETPDPILALDAALDDDGCAGLETQYEFWVAREDNAEPLGAMASAYVVYALDLHDDAGCTFALDF
jgi:hypothetical protein